MVRVRRRERVLGLICSRYYFVSYRMENIPQRDGE